MMAKNNPRKIRRRARRESKSSTQAGAGISVKRLSDVGSEPQDPAGDFHRGKPYPIVGIGASAGGFEAFTELLKALPSDTGSAYVIVQHLDPGHESMLSRLLSKSTEMPIEEVREGMAVEPNHVYVIPPNTTMSIRDGVLHLVAGRKSPPRRMPIDHFFFTLAEDQGSRAIGVILSGTASDGTLGLKAIKGEGGITFAQDEHTARYDGMPRSAVAAGCVDFVLPPAEIARELARIGRHPYLGVASRAQASEIPADDDDELRKIFILLRNATGVDFTHYKYTTIRRRIARRMVLHKFATLKQYLDYLHGYHDELKALYDDILIQVTGFFREPDSFQSLKEEVFPEILNARAPGETIRIWVPGCSTGEEVYSMAIALLEYLGDRANDNPFQLFGTDISEVSIDKARAGIYVSACVSEVSRERLRNFFMRTQDGYQVAKSVREMCIFARQDLGKDPPFSRLDLISCRNVLIYMGPVLQKKVMSIFHYALKPTGFLMLGKSESVSGFADMFQLVDRKHKIYAKKVSQSLPVFDLTPAGQAKIATETPAEPHGLRLFDVQKEADRIVLAQHAPAGLIVGDNLQILHFRGECSPYLSPQPGEASLGLLRLVRPEFALELRAAIHRARKQGSSILKEGIRVRRGRRWVDVSLEIIPITSGSDGRFYLVLFKDTPVSEEDTALADTRSKAVRTMKREVDHLQRELLSTREYLQSIIEDQEATNEELKSANEEVLSSNEELQSTNEELETAKEELQSANEELVTVNEQLQNRNAELGLLSDDLANLLSGVNIPIVMLGSDRCIRRFTPQAEKLLNLLPSDVGRPMANIRANINIPELEDLITQVIDTVSRRELEVTDSHGHWYALRMLPYRTQDNRIDGVVLTFIDIDALKRAHLALEREMSLAAAVRESAGALMMVTDANGLIVQFNRACAQISGYSPKEVLGKCAWDLLSPVDQIETWKNSYRKMMESESPSETENHLLDRNGRLHLINWSRSLMRGSSEDPAHVVWVGTDVVARREAEQVLHESEKSLHRSEDQLRLLTKSLLTAQEDERRRVSRDLHDDIAQNLAAVIIELERMQKKLPLTREELENLFEEATRRLVELSDRLRSTAHSLHPAALFHLGLAPAVKSLCSELSRQSGLRVSLTHRSLPARIPEEVAICAYRVVQEATRNAISHSGAEHVHVSLSARANCLFASVRDGGRGFEPMEARPKGLGLVSIEERIRQVGGTLKIKSMPGEGTCLDFKIPLTEAESRSKPD